jgi:hypothetical protein
LRDDVVFLLVFVAVLGTAAAFLGAAAGFATGAAFTALGAACAASCSARAFAAAMRRRLIFGATILLTLLFNSLDNTASDFFCFSYRDFP